MKKLTTLLIISGLFFACTKVPITGRRQLNLLPESQMIGMSKTAYTEFLSTNKQLPSTNKDAEMIERVGKKLSAAVESYLKKTGKGKRVEGFEWEYKLVDDNTVNAWCMPGGKIVFYTGILGVCQDEAGVAVVMGHEIAHAIARHGNERMSQQLAIQGGGLTLSVLTNEKPELVKGIFNQAYAIGSGLGSLAFSRSHETEADKMGLVFMALAGYDPREAPKFWERMAAVGGAKPPEMLSTHPSDERRIKDLKEFMPEALKYYKK